MHSRDKANGKSSTRSLYLKQWFSCLALFALLTACNDHKEKAFVEEMRDVQSDSKPNHSNCAALLKKKWAQVMPEIVMNKFENIHETFTAEHIAGMESEKPDTYTITLGRYKGGGYSTLVESQSYQLNGKGELIALTRSNPIQKISLITEQGSGTDDPSHITVKWGDKEEESMALFQKPESMKDLYGEWKFMQYEGYIIPNVPVRWDSLTNVDANAELPKLTMYDKIVDDSQFKKSKYGVLFRGDKVNYLYFEKPPQLNSKNIPTIKYNKKEIIYIFDYDEEKNILTAVYILDGYRQAKWQKKVE